MHSIAALQVIDMRPCNGRRYSERCPQASLLPPVLSVHSAPANLYGELVEPVVLFSGTYHADTACHTNPGFGQPCNARQPKNGYCLV